MNETPPAPGPLLRYTSGAHKQQPPFPASTPPARDSTGLGTYLAAVGLCYEAARVCMRIPAAPEPRLANGRSRR